MDDEQVQLLGKPSVIPPEYGWQSLLGLHGDGLESHYRHILAELGTGSGLTPVIFRKAQNRIQDPAKLRRLVELINGETWIGLDVDVKGSIYEGLLEKNAQDIKSGAGQYFTPRPLIQAIVDVMRPTPADTICDPAAGTCGFLLAAYDYILRHHHPLDRDQLDDVTHHALRGWEIVDNAARLGVMNLHLHGIGANAETSPIHVGDALQGVEDLPCEGMRPWMRRTNEDPPRHRPGPYACATPAASSAPYPLVRSHTFRRESMQPSSIAVYGKAGERVPAGGDSCGLPSRRLCKTAWCIQCFIPCWK